VKNATIATAFIAMAGIALGHGVSDGFSGKDPMASAADPDVSSQQASGSATPPAVPPSGSGIFIGRATWTPAGISAHYDGGVRLGNREAMHPALGRGLAFDERRDGGKPEAL